MKNEIGVGDAIIVITPCLSHLIVVVIDGIARLEKY
jgi:hypothetical protein